jgi:transcriptional regulator with XRE-family HTH domain
MIRIKFERLQRGWNQTALAYHAGMSAGDISRIESGRLKPYPAQIEKLSAVLGVEPNALLVEVPSTAPVIGTAVA